MSRDLIVRPEAELDLLEAQEWYQQQRDGLGAEFREAIEDALDRIKENPLQYPLVHRRLVRRAVTRRFPYLIFFVVEANVVSVIACPHSSRDPRLLEDRSL